MRTQFFLRNLCISVLMAVVLILGVQGTAEAIDAPFGSTAKTGDLQSVTAGSVPGPSITFSISLQTPANIEDNSNPPKLLDESGRRINSSGYRVVDIDGTPYRISAAATRIRGYRAPTATEPATPTYRSAQGRYVGDTDTNVVDSAGRAVFTDTGLTSGNEATAQPDDQVPEGKRRHYNEEAIKISVSGGGAKITSITDTTNTYSNLSDTSYTIKEMGGNTDTLASNATSITVALSTSSHGKVTITISDVTPNADLANGASDKQPNLVFTVYVMRPVWEVPRRTALALRGVTNGVGDGFFDGNDQPIYNGDSNHYPVTYTVTGTGTDGGVYVKEGNRPSSPDPQRSLPTSSGAKVYLRMVGDTRVVTLKVTGTDGEVETKGIYIYGNPTLDVSETTNTNQSGNPGTVLTTAFTATVEDGSSGTNPVQNVPVKFEVQDKGITTGGTLIPVSGATIVDARNMEITSPTSGSIIYVRTNSSGIATINFQLGSASGEQLVDVSAVGFKKTIKATTLVSDATRVISLHANQSQPGSSNVFNLAALVENGGNADPGEIVTFRETLGSGTLMNTPTGLTLDGEADTATRQTGKQVTDITDSLGRAQVIYDAGGNTGRAEVKASISVVTNTGVTTHLKEITFAIRGGPPPGDPGDEDEDEDEDEEEDTNTITVDPTSLSGETGDRVELTVNAGTATVTITGAAFTSAGGLFTETGNPRVLLLPTTAGRYELTVSAPNYTSVTVPVIVTAAAAPAESGPGTLRITTIGARSGNQQAIRVTASPTPTSDLVVTLSGVTNPTSLTIDAGSSSQVTVATLVNASAAQIVTANATGYDAVTITIPAVTPGATGTGTPPTTPGTTPTATPGEPSRITINGLSAHSGTVNQQLDVPLSVRVFDANGLGVANAKVIFRVTGSGQGRLSQRGNGRAIPKETDRSGYARADFTPLSAGTITVQAEAKGVTEKVTFTITTGSVPPAPRDPTPGPTTPVSPVVNAAVDAASRPPMLWISGGKIYGLVGSEVKVFISTVENATNLAIDGNKVYWTAKTSDTHGTLNAANLDGTDAEQLRTLWGVPRGITVDTGKLYWVDAANRLQSSNLDGSGIENVLRGLSDPRHVAVSGGKAYWIGNGEGTDTLSSISLTDPRKVINPIAATSGTYGGLAIGNGKLYWTEKTSETHGQVLWVNLDGTEEPAPEDGPIWGAPVGIAVDTARSHLYWTDAVGRLQRANLDGSGIHNVIRGLGRPGDMVISNSITVPAPTTPTSTDTNKYDVNGDGTVDIKDIDMLLVAVSAGLTDAKYDVNGDGKVDVSDVVAVSANRSAGAAGAPTLLGTKFSAIEVERLQEQIDLLIATGDRSPAALKTLIYLQQLIALARPEKTQLLANYPNPFNPETWIPYELATDTDVRITIYNSSGVVVRALHLGHQTAGYYTDRDRAAYWDGRNALGEQVASGIYFYQLETDEMSALRKMVILK